MLPSEFNFVILPPQEEYNTFSFMESCLETNDTCHTIYGNAQRAKGAAKKLTPFGSCRCLHYRPRRLRTCCRNTNSGTALLERGKIRAESIQEAQITDEHLMYTENTWAIFLVNKNVA
jgi:hypothetical protein